MTNYTATEVAYQNGYDAGVEAMKTRLLEETNITYYVIKNPDTGLYFRGKGVNRWGMYFNQASIYRIKGTAEASCREINQYNRNGERAEIIPIKIIELDP